MYGKLADAPKFSPEEHWLKKLVIGTTFNIEKPFIDIYSKIICVK